MNTNNPWSELVKNILENQLQEREMRNLLRLAKAKYRSASPANVAKLCKSTWNGSTLLSERSQALVMDAYSILESEGAL